METASLKSFAMWARTALIREVTARIAVVLAPASLERVEQPTVVAALERYVNAAGGGHQGRSAVADRVAYTWFNRIIALRFMDANGYTGIGVVSPQVGVDVGQPEILAEAKRGNIDPEIVGQRAREAVTALLNGTRRSDDPQGEAYALLLAEYCRYWNRSMPFMFERAGDFTELLIPASLLADDSVLNRAAKVLTSNVCQDVEVIGWLYQFYISERKDEVFVGFKKNQKAGADEIPAATQLFTPDWIVRYLVENSLGRLWMLNHPGSGLIHRMEYYITPEGGEIDFLKIKSPEQLKVIDPACGSGHMLAYAFDLLYAIYEEEGYSPSSIAELILANNLYGTEIDPRAGALAAFSLAMKARARMRTFFRKQVDVNVCVLEPISFSTLDLEFLSTATGDRIAEGAFWNQFTQADLFGALVQPRDDLLKKLRPHIDSLSSKANDLLAENAMIRARRVMMQADYLTTGYDVVVTNPPYMGSRNMNSVLSEGLVERYPESKSDLFSAFICRCAALGTPGARVGIMSPNVWMYISSHLALREKLLTDWPIQTLIELPLAGFSEATVQICAFAFKIQAATPANTVDFIRLVDQPGGATAMASLARTAIKDRATPWRYSRQLREVQGLPGSPVAYWLPSNLLGMLRRQRTLQDVSPPRQGIATADNARFLRHWWEVSIGRARMNCRDDLAAKNSGARWFPYNKGGDYRRWYGNQEFVINWQDSGFEIKNFLNSTGKQRSAVRNPSFQFRSSISWSLIGSGLPSFRYFPQGFLFDVAGMSVFGATDKEERKILGLLNSVLTTRILQAYAPTLNFQVGDIARLPVPDDTNSIENDEVVSELVTLARNDWDENELSWNFQASPICMGESLEKAYQDYRLACHERVGRVIALEQENNHHYLDAFNLTGEYSEEVLPSRVSFDSNLEFRYRYVTNANLSVLGRAEEVRRLVSYAVGCMFGRYSLDAPGLIIADQGMTLQDYLAKVHTPSFIPDADNVIPIVDGDWFEDDIVARFREFLRAAFGEQHFEENLRFATEALGVKNLRDYFVKTFYKDHVQRYKKRPIYWLFSSTRGTFSALIYVHRYTPSSVSTVLNEYLREYKAKLGSSLQHHERLAAGGGTPRDLAAAQKETDRLRKVLLELEEYEHDVLYPLASQQIEIDLDDGVKVNYPKFGAAMKKIPGLEVAE
ncbi:BREX-1 system adenine-specific DNA-methyltransferase PglX [Rhodococcoides fascians]|uniref:BREX-1 system adenine-specific DNA-methyltransferase PglX n=1 Tax=Rhodococcoides fascians TaxID=1828 RepID=UPI00050C7407|nr:BREX-1 system adenine-specific DNA-methyltransferase PglX [Rhodococcus fascians]